mmetsp:Transcript_94243/g.167582  ORF Transcript_94243/g.167582 Transcript_94243/m.167582 type:complete len:370 (-) Transcript_94243:173-1282(-)
MAPGVSAERGRSVCNAGIEEWVRQKHLDAHKKNIARSKSTIVNQWSVREENKIGPSRRNAKKEQATEERYSRIEKENRRLLGRMQDIERRGSSKLVGQLVVGAPKAPQRSGSVPAAGSRVSVRVKEMQRIDAENQRLLKRLQGAQSAVNMKKNDESYKEQQRYMRMRCEHQHEDWILERAQEQALLQAQMAEKAALRAPPGPISQEPEGPSDAECIRLLHLQDRLREKAAQAEELEEENDWDEDEQTQMPETDEAEDGEDGQDIEAEQAAPVVSPSKERVFIGGTIPETSKNLVEKLLAEYAADAERAELSTEAQADAAKAAAAAAFREAEAVDVSSQDVFLSYERVVQNRMNREKEAIAYEEEEEEDD